MSAAKRGVVSPATDRDLLAVAGIAAVCTAIGVISVELVVAAGLAAALLGAPMQLTPPKLTHTGLTPPGGWLRTAVLILNHAEDPGRRLAAPWSVLAGHPLLYWAVAAVAAVLLTATAAAVGVGGGWVWRWCGPTPSGHATRAQIRRVLSVQAARRTAAWTRPGMPARDRARAPLEEVGVPLHRGPIGPMCSPYTSPTGTIAPTQTGKSRADLVHKVLAAPGGLLCSTTKPDLLEFTALARTRRRHPGRCWCSTRPAASRGPPRCAGHPSPAATTSAPPTSGHARWWRPLRSTSPTWPPGTTEYSGNAP